MLLRSIKAGLLYVPLVVVYSVSHVGHTHAPTPYSVTTETSFLPCDSRICCSSQLTVRESLCCLCQIQFPPWLVRTYGEDPLHFIDLPQINARDLISVWTQEEPSDEWMLTPFSPALCHAGLRPLLFLKYSLCQEWVVGDYSQGAGRTFSILHSHIIPQKPLRSGLVLGMFST